MNGPETRPRAPHPYGSTGLHAMALTGRHYVCGGCGVRTADLAYVIRHVVKMQWTDPRLRPLPPDTEAA